MKRISVIGCGGSGKTTLAHILSNKTNLPVYHMDCIAYGPNWSEVNPVQFHTKHEKWILKDRWIIEGMMIDCLDRRVQRSSLVIFLDTPRWLCLYRIFKRLVSQYGKTRDDMAEGCKESFDWPFLKYVWNFNKNTRAKIIEILDKSPENCEIVIIKNRCDLEKWKKTYEPYSEKI